MDVVINQQRTFLRLVHALRPHWRRDAGLPARIQSLFAAHRGFGSRDRRLYRELIYTTLRYLPWVEPWLDEAPEEALRRVAWLASEIPATRAFRAATAQGEPPTGDKAELLPGWFRPHCPEIFSGLELETQLRRAPLWLRLSATPAGAEQILAEFDSRGWSWRRAPSLAGAVELEAEVDVTQTDAWKNGHIEVQDLGSQLILESIGVSRGSRWLDACAGAGGKTLQLARLLGPGGGVDAHDVRRSALEELARRYRRVESGLAGPARAAGIATVRLLESAANSRYDGVLVDAPCSGSGTWRRAPHLKWTTTAEQIARAASTQLALLRQFSAHVSSGGRLVYATCSLSSRENEDVVATFLSDQPDFEPAPFAATFGAVPRGAGILIFPALHDSDGFFVASLRRR